MGYSKTVYKNDISNNQFLIGKSRMDSNSSSLTHPLFEPEALRAKNHLSPVGLVWKRGRSLSSKSKNNTLIKYLINIFTPLNSRKNKRKNKTNSQKEIDLVLEKISKSGYNSLNKEEKDLLFRSSKK